jgi:hypothetical protein
VRPLVIEDPEDGRFDLALDEFERGRFFVFEPIGGIGFVDEVLQVRVATAWEPDSVSAARANEELERAVRNYDRLRDASVRFRTLTESYEPSFVLLYDYGMGGIELCRWRDGEIVWKDGYPRAAPTV